jgi:hypothetical protein
VFVAETAGAQADVKRFPARVALPAVLLALGLLALLKADLATRAEQHFVFLAKSFLEGRLDFTEVPGTWADTSPYEGRHYWPLGPLPALLLMPFVWIGGVSLQQGPLLFAFNALNLALLFRIAKRITGSDETALWLTFAYVFATNYLYVGLVAWSWYFAQAVATAFTLWALCEYLGRRRWWVIGAALALGMTARVTVVLAGLFFGVSVLLDDSDGRAKVRRLAQLTAPVVVGLAGLLAYNFLRFGSIAEFGYSSQILAHEPAVNRTHGVWSLEHVPANLYYLFFRGPEGVFLPGSKVLQFPYLRPSIWGMSILFTSPVFLAIVRAPWRDRTVRLAAATSGLMLAIVLGYYGIGVRQYGYRYALDFYPFLFLILCRSTGDRPPGALRVLIVLSALFNYLFIPSVLGQGPGNGG